MCSDSHNRCDITYDSLTIHTTSVWWLTQQMWLHLWFTYAPYNRRGVTHNTCDITYASLIIHGSYVVMIDVTSVMWDLTSDKPTGWQRPIGCLKLQIIFRKRATNYRALLRKMTYEDKTSYGSSPPCKRNVTDENAAIAGFYDSLMIHESYMSHDWCHVCYARCNIR
jgi:hypothetical protein